MAVEYIDKANPDGTTFGQSTSDKISFQGATPIVQRSSATLSATVSLFALTGASFVANTSTSLSGFLVLNTTLASQIFDALQEIRAALVAYGLHKGGA